MERIEILLCLGKRNNYYFSVLAYFVVCVAFILLTKIFLWLSFKLSSYRYKFKARELDPRILEGGPILPKKPPVKPPTQPIGFDLEIEKRIQERESKKKSEDEHFEFHSRPCPTKILEDVVVRMVEALHAGRSILLVTKYPPIHKCLSRYYDQGIVLGAVGDKET